MTAFLRFTFYALIFASLFLLLLPAVQDVRCEQVPSLAYCQEQP